MAKLTLIRGLPGSGKSTYARLVLRADVHYEADQFFLVGSNDDYVFDASLIKIAHEWCFSNTVRALRRGHDVVVSNTFTQLWELNKYLELLRLIPDLEVEIVEMKTQYGTIHNVPEDTLKKMAERWEDISEAYIELQKLNVKKIENV